MRKKYLNFKDYIIDKKQSKIFKKWDGTGYLFTESVVVLSNNNITKNFELNIDKFKNTTIIIQNSSFDNLNITEFNENNNKVILKKCIVNNAELHLFQNSSVSIVDCEVQNKLNLTAHNAELTNINNDNTIEPIIINVFSDNVVELENISGNIYLTLEAKEIKIEKCVTWLNVEQTNKLFINKSNMFINKINSTSIIEILASKIKHPLINSENALIDTKFMNVSNVSEVNNCYIKANDINILENSYLLFQNSYFEINGHLDIKENSFIFDSQYKKSILDIKNILIHPNSGIDVLGLECSNESEEYINIEYNNLKNERKKLVKILSLINNKYNPQLKDLE